ncbi:MAG TPA: CHAD domain-containing protein [Nocardioidaceae bacterium]|nr:CHAD domain-containing protein [Nocardioidaceae bacterium]
MGEGSVGEVLQHELTRHLSELREQDRRVRDDAQSAVHKMRIAVRRLRSLLATYRQVLTPGSGDEIRAELRWLGNELSAARDAQVMSERLDALIRDEPAELVMGPVSRRIHMELSDRYQAGRKQALEALDDARYSRLLGLLDAFVAAPPFNDKARRDAREQLPRLLSRDLERVRHRAEAVTDAASPAQRDMALHDTRKAAKRLRYGAESATPVLGRRAKRLATRAKRVQELLGEHQDTVVARLTLRELGAQAYVANENGFTFGRLHALEQARASEIEHRCPAVLERLPSGSLERWLRA